MLALADIDLARDPAAARYLKSETVHVSFAREAGELISLEGPNRYQPGDAIVTGSTGSRWSVARERFEAKYQAVPPLANGADGAYAARPVPVWARQFDQPFTAERSAGGDRLTGNAGDWLLQYGPGDFGIAADERFSRIYRKIR